VIYGRFAANVTNKKCLVITALYELSHSPAFTRSVDSFLASRRCICDFYARLNGRGTKTRAIRANDIDEHAEASACPNGFLRRVESLARLRPPADLRERGRRVTAFAGSPERSVVHIVATVTPIAIGAQRHRGHVFCRVAGLAIEPAMGARQGEARSCGMVEAPSVPTVWIVAKRAVAS
jgi:hypothetical protein